MDTFALSKRWFEFAYESKDAKPHHASLYFYLIDRANRSGWKEWVKLHRDTDMETACIGSNSTYKKALEFLEKEGFVEIDWGTKNQWRGTYIRLSHLYKSVQPVNKALAKALYEQLPKQDTSTLQSSVHTIKPNNPITSEPENLVTTREDYFKNRLLKESAIKLDALKVQNRDIQNWDDELDQWNSHLESRDENPESANALFHSFKKWIGNAKKFGNKKRETPVEKYNPNL